MIDATEMIAMPGFVNVHIHVSETMMRGAGGNWVNDEYFDVCLDHVAEHVTPDGIYDPTLFGALGQLNTGSTAMLEWCHHATTPGGTSGAKTSAVTSVSGPS